jgi:hypothetical protein
MTREEICENLKIIITQINETVGNRYEGINSPYIADIKPNSLRFVIKETIKLLEQESKEITLEDVKGYCKPRLLTIITNELYYELTHPTIKVLKQEPCDYAISRQAVLEIFGYVMDYWKEHAIDVEPHEIKDALIEQYEFTAKQLSELPPVNPQPKMGHWIKSKDGYMRCDQCGSRGSAIKARFCHHCGARMESEGT